MLVTVTLVMTLGANSRSRRNSVRTPIRTVGEGSLTAPQGLLRALPDDVSKPPADRFPADFGLPQSMGSRALSWTCWPDAASGTGFQFEIGPVRPRRGIAPGQVLSGGSAWCLGCRAGVTRSFFQVGLVANP
jgi:hypothetical protein